MAKVNRRQETSQSQAMASVRGETGKGAWSICNQSAYPKPESVPKRKTCLQKKEYRADGLWVTNRTLDSVAVCHLMPSVRPSVTNSCYTQAYARCSWVRAGTHRAHQGRNGGHKYGGSALTAMAIWGTSTIQRFKGQHRVSASSAEATWRRPRQDADL